MTSTYAKAYTEVLEILKYLPSEQYKKIPKEKIEFYEKYKDTNYVCNYDSTKTLNEQNILRETRAIIISIFRDFFATTIQKEKLKKILLNNEQKYQQELKEKHNWDNIFEKNKTKIKQDEFVENKTTMVEYKESIFTKIKNWFKRNF